MENGCRLGCSTVYIEAATVIGKHTVYMIRIVDDGAATAKSEELAQRTEYIEGFRGDLEKRTEPYMEEFSGRMMAIMEKMVGDMGGLVEGALPMEECEATTGDQEQSYQKSRRMRCFHGTSGSSRCPSFAGYRAFMDMGSRHNGLTTKRPNGQTVSASNHRLLHIHLSLFSYEPLGLRGPVHLEFPSRGPSARYSTQ